MEIRGTFTNRSGQVIEKRYSEDDPLNDLEGKILQAVHAFCFYKGKLVIIYSESKKTWSVPGGGIEPGESIEMAVAREVKEESNMKVLHQEFIGYQDMYEPDRTVRQTRSFCIVEPFGDFISDPDEGEVTEMKLIDPKDYKQYFDWGEIGAHIMKEAVRRLENLDSEDSVQVPLIS